MTATAQNGNGPSSTPKDPHDLRATFGLDLPFSNNPLTVNQLMQYAQELVDNVQLSRAQLMQAVDPDRRRNVNHECGFPDEPTLEHYRSWFEHDPFGRRICGVYPSESWMVSPGLYERENPDPRSRTPFESDWYEVNGQLLGEQNYYEDEECSPVWEALYRADELSRVGHYGVVAIGIDDRRELREPADLKPGKKRRNLTSLSTFPEYLAPIARFVNDRNNPRFGLPEAYNVTFHDPRDQYSGTAPNTNTEEVHWTRVVHLAEKVRSNAVYADPAMRTCYRNLMSLHKVIYGSGEMYWRGALPGYSWETHPQLGGQVKVDSEKLRNSMEQFFNGLQRYVLGKGMAIKSLAPQVVDPTSQFDAQVKAICVDIEVPYRIFLGSEQGVLAADQDSIKFYKGVGRRNRRYLAPNVVARTINRLIGLGILTAPKQYYQDWPDLFSLTDEQKADIALKRTQALAAFVSGGVDTIYPLREFLTLEMHLSDAEADLIIEKAAAAAEGNSDAGGAPLLGLVGGITGMIELWKAANDGAVSEDQLRALIKLFFRVSDDVLDDLMADGLTPAAEEAGDPTEPDPEPPSPIKVKEGEELVDPRKIVSKTPTELVPPPSANEGTSGDPLADLLIED
jgi:hypothetical protein